MRADALGQALGDVLLRQRRPILDAAGLDEVDGVAVSAERPARRRDVVGEYPIAALARQLLARVAHDLLGLGGKADDEGGSAIARLTQRLQDVGILGELERGRLAILL